MLVVMMLNRWSVASEWQKRRSTGRRARSWKNERRGRNKCLDLEGAREKGSSDSTMRLGRITTRKVQSLGAAAQRKAQRSRVRLAVTERELEDRFDVRQRACAPRRPRRERLSAERLRLTNQITTCAVVCLASDVLTSANMLCAAADAAQASMPTLS